MAASIHVSDRPARWPACVNDEVSGGRQRLLHHQVANDLRKFRVGHLRDALRPHDFATTRPEFLGVGCPLRHALIEDDREGVRVDALGNVEAHEVAAVSGRHRYRRIGARQDQVFAALHKFRHGGSLPISIPGYR